ncbi:MAG: hypothetical protein KBT88_13185 [Gammaproteobacteria bacterium]|nr:hypothetical protein [Gammaproteobacteria bacterium]MBQ0840731.1 hypothetical protein [Gammaproteobacteria bacterium]
MKKALNVAAAISGIAIIVIAYGYWHSISHGSAYIDLTFETPDTIKKDLLSKARVLFLDAEGNILAAGERDKEYNFVHLIHPSAGDCHAVENRAASSGKAKKQWRDCFAKQSLWIPTWINNVRQVLIKHPYCTSKPLPIIISAHNNGWLLWWVPHPHIGGKPYSYFRSSILIKDNDCIGKPLQ